MKTCTKCHIEKPLEDFYEDASAGDGRRTRCKACWRKMVSDYNESPEGKAKRKKYAQKTYRKNRREKIKYAQEWRLKNLADHKRNNDKYFRSRQGRARLAWLKARRRHKGPSEKFVPFDKVLKSFEDGVCERTGIAFEFGPHEEYRRHMYGPSIDKIDPKGDYTEDNIHVVCNMYNFGKNEYTHEEFLEFCRAFVAHVDGVTNQ